MGSLQFFDEFALFPKCWISQLCRIEKRQNELKVIGFASQNGEIFV